MYLYGGKLPKMMDWKMLEIETWTKHQDLADLAPVVSPKGRRAALDGPCTGHGESVAV